MFNTETFIARRLGIRGQSAGVMLRVATVGVAISLAVMLIALGVVGGFRAEIGRQVAGFTAPIQVAARGGGHAYESTPVARDVELERQLGEVDGVGHVQRFATKAGILRGDSSIRGVLFKGIGPEYDTTFLHRKLVEGTVPVYSDRALSREAVISRSLAREMRLAPGDRFEVLFIGSGAPRRERLRVAGVYHSGMPEFDQMLVVGDLRAVQRLNGWHSDQISGYEVALTQRRLGRGLSEAQDVIGPVREAIGQGPELLAGWGDLEGDGGPKLQALTLRERYPHIFDWLDMLDTNTAIVIVIMLIVAVVNMISGVLIVVLEQTRTVGILKALGMRGGMLQRIFVLRTAGVTLKGMGWGNLIGLGLCGLQQATGWLTLDAENYLVSVVPVSLGWVEVVGLNGLVFCVVTAMMMLPTLILARMTPDRAIRFQ